MPSRPLIAIFAKAPVRGRVKTRLAADIGDDGALEVYRRLLTRTVTRLTRPEWRTELWITPDLAATDDALWPGTLPRAPQGPGDLGARMLRALDRATEIAPAIVVGTDIPDLDACHIEEALAALDRSRLVFGPSGDGGFYLVGLRGKRPPGFLEAVAWSRSDTLDRAIASAETVGSALINPLDDLDDMRVFEKHRDEPNWRTLLDGLRDAPHEAKT